MNISAIVQEFNLPLTRSEQALVAKINGSVATSSEDRYKQQLKALADAREVIKQLPDKQTSDRQRRSEKASMLKERLKMIRQMLPYLSPKAAKSLRDEMKQIASQLASLQSDGASGNISAAVAPDATTAAVTTWAGNGAEYNMKKEKADTAEQNKNSEDQQGQQTPSGSTLQEQRLKDKEKISENREWKETIEELKNLYKSVLAALKRKQSAEHDTRQIPNHSELRTYTAIHGTANNVTIKV